MTLYRRGTTVIEIIRLRFGGVAGSEAQIRNVAPLAERKPYAEWYPVALLLAAGWVEVRKP